MVSVDSISKIGVKLLLKEPFYGHFLMGIPKEISSETPTAAVALMHRQSVKLIVNASFWESLSDDHRYGLIKHEVLHIVLKHLFTFRKFSNKQLYNIAADLVVNQYIDKKQLPEGGIVMEQFAYLKPMYGIQLDRDMDVGYYYEKLNRVLKEKALVPFATAMGRVSQLEGGGHRQTGLDELLSEDHPEMARHSFWKEVETLSEGESKLAEIQVNRVIKATSSRVRHKYNNFGNLPLGLVEKLEDILKALKPKFNWKRMLRLFATSSNSTFLKNTIRRASKRYGTVPGIKLRRRNKLLLAIDTSGSVDSKDFIDFFAEMFFIWKQGSEIEVVECDTQIQNIYKYRGKIPQEIKGRGGTSFEAPINYANKEYWPDALIYFTDGYAPAPRQMPRYPVLWVITSGGIAQGQGSWDDLPGRKLKMS